MLQELIRVWAVLKFLILIVGSKQMICTYCFLGYKQRADDNSNDAFILFLMLL
jgi:hypothetical protein